MNEKLLPTAILLAILIPVLVFSGFYFGQKNGRQKGYALGQKAGYSQGYSAAPKPTLEELTAEQNYSDLNQKYNDLVSDYNSLRQTAINYVNASSYLPKSPIICNTHNYDLLNSSTTTCY